jgi:hypothetical protein
MLVLGKNRTPQRSWAVFAFLAAAAASVWFFWERAATGEWPGGSSLVGMTLGVLGGVIILFEFLLWWKKKVRVWRIGTAQAWMRAHIWLGLLCVPLLIYHSGLRLGGPLSTYLMILLLIVVVSGVWGLWLQHTLPRRMLDTVPAETIFSQIESLADKQAEEMEQLVLAVCGTAPGKEAAVHAEQAGFSYLVVGAVRTAGRVQGKVIETWVPPAPVADAETLRAFFQASARPYLLRGKSAHSALRFPNRAQVMFLDLKTKLPAAAHPAVDRLAAACDQRRQWDEQIRLHRWLHSWLWIHFPLSVALVLLMFVHIYAALKYW